MHGVGFAEGKRSNLRVETISVLRDHLVGAFHHAERRRERTTGCVLERFSCLQGGLLSDNARSADFFDVAGTIGDDPMSGEQLNRLGAFVRDLDRIQEKPLVLVG